MAPFPPIISGADFFKPKLPLGKAPIGPAREWEMSTN